MDKGEGGRSLKKRKYITGTVITILLIALIAGAVAGIMAYDRKKTQEAIDSIEQEILILCCVIGPFGEDIPTVKYGYFIDKYGNKCYFDITEQRYYESMDIYKYLEEHIEEYEKIPFLKEKQVLAIYQHLNSIDSSAEIVWVKSERSTRWSCEGFCMSEKGEIECIFLEISGGAIAYTADENVEKIMEIIGKDTWRDEEELQNRFR